MASERILPTIHSPADVKALPFEALGSLCGEIRQALIQTISQNGGHLASNLGVVELTTALHRVFSSPKDQIVWDVGHQCYPHKLLTGRYASFATLRREYGLSGFCRPEESEHDPFISGHSSTSISAAFGLAKAKSLQGDDGYTIAVIGDGALTGGLAYEGLNNAGRSRDRLIVILNDNKMSISRNVGSVARHLAVLRSSPRYLRFKKDVERFLQKVPIVGQPLDRAIVKVKSGVKSMLYGNTLFENMGFAYLGPVDGHDLGKLCAVLESCKTLHQPVLLHVCTVKGKGYTFAEERPKDFHGTSGFDIETGDAPASRENFSSVFGREICDLAGADPRICAVTAAMTESTGLTEFSHTFRSRFFDVGIAEEHAITFCSGLAKNGMLPVFAVYSTFLQRGYDELIHDAALQNAKIVLCIDRAGLVGEDGETHQGVFDAAFLNTIPNVTIFAPSFYTELCWMLKEAVYQYKGVVAVRYPRGGEPSLPEGYCAKPEPYSVLGGGGKVLLITYGRIFANLCRAREALAEKGIEADVLKLNRIKPIDPQAVQLARGYRKVFFFEEGIRTGGVAEHFGFVLLSGEFAGSFSLHTLPDGFIAQSTVGSAMKKYHLDAESITQIVEQECEL